MILYKKIVAQKLSLEKKRGGWVWRRESFDEMK
jgi:hypothetical protein